MNLPTDESFFHVATGDEELMPKLGLWAYMIKLVDIFGYVLDLNRHLVDHPADDVESAVLDLSQQFRAWEVDLPASYRLSHDNLAEWQRYSHGGTFVALHFGFHHYQTVLYFHYLNDTKSARSEDHAALCRHHAVEFAHLLEISRTRRIACSYPTIGHMTLVSSAVLIHTLLYGPEYMLESVRALLVSNFAAITELKEQWPCLQRTVSRSRCFLATS